MREALEVRSPIRICQRRASPPPAVSPKMPSKPFPELQELLHAQQLLHLVKTHRHVRLLLSAYRRLLDGLPDRVSVSSTNGRSKIGQGEIVPRKFEKSFLIGALPVWVRTAVDVIFNDITCLACRVGTEVGNASLDDRLVFFRTSCISTVGREFGNIRARNYYGKVAVRVERQLTLWIGSKKIHLLAVILHRDGNERPRPNKLLGRRLAK